MNVITGFFHLNICDGGQVLERGLNCRGTGIPGDFSRSFATKGKAESPVNNIVNRDLLYFIVSRTAFLRRLDNNRWERQSERTCESVVEQLNCAGWIGLKLFEAICESAGDINQIGNTAIDQREFKVKGSRHGGRPTGAIEAAQQSDDLFQAIEDI